MEARISSYWNLDRQNTLAYRCLDVMRYHTTYFDYYGICEDAIGSGEPTVAIEQILGYAYDNPSVYEYLPQELFDFVKDPVFNGMFYVVGEALLEHEPKR